MGSEWHTSFAAKSQIHGNPSFVDARLCLDPENEEVSLFPHETLRYMGFIWFYMIFWWSFTSMYIYIWVFIGGLIAALCQMWRNSTSPWSIFGDSTWIHHGFTMDSPWISKFHGDYDGTWWYVVILCYFQMPLHRIGGLAAENSEEELVNSEDFLAVLILRKLSITFRNWLVWAVHSG